MKKLLSVLLVTVILVSAVFGLTSCFEKKDGLTLDEFTSGMNDIDDIELVDLGKLVEALAAFFLFLALVERLDFLARELGDLVGVEADLRDLHGEDLVLFQIETHDLAVERLHFLNQRTGVLAGASVSDEFL